MDDCALGLAALNEPDLQELASCLSTAAKAFGLTIRTNISKFQFDQESGRRRTTFWMGHLQIIIYLHLLISLQKTEVLLQPAPVLAPPQPNIEIEGTKLDNVECFQHLGSTVTSTCSMDKEVPGRLAIAGASFVRLWTRVWGKRGITVCT